jgi:hypothetical protein
MLASTTRNISLTRDELNAAYAIIRHNVRTYRSAGVVEVVKGEHNAQSALQNLVAGQSPADHHEGWRYFLEKTSMKAGTDPSSATDVRQAELEERESKAMTGPDAPGVPNSDR